MKIFPYFIASLSLQLKLASGMAFCFAFLRALILGDRSKQNQRVRLRHVFWRRAKPSVRVKQSSQGIAEWCDGIIPEAFPLEEERELWYDNRPNQKGVFMAQERKGAITFKGNPMTLIGPELKVGAKAPDFQVLAGDLSTVTLQSFKGKAKLISVVPSLDTPVCDQQTRRFNEEAGKLPADVAVLTISMDLPFAQKRFCSTAGIDKIKTLSDHREASFGQAFGVLIKELKLLTRAVFILGPDDQVQYAEYVKEVTNHPNYDAVLAFFKSSVGK